MWDLHAPGVRGVEGRAGGLTWPANDQEKAVIGLYTNSNDRSDFTHSAFATLGAKVSSIYAAVAFVTHPDPLLVAARRGCRVRIIVGLRYPTHPRALEELMNQEGISVRYVSGHSFHPKLYLFVDEAALVGSSNLTESALLTNQEVNVVLSAEDPRYEELVELFLSYWDQVEVLNEDRLKEYRRTYNLHSKARSAIEEFNRACDGIGNSTIANVTRHKGRTKSSSELYLHDYRQTYQEFQEAFRTVRRLYEEVGRRRYDEGELPLRIEIDNFLSWIREKHAIGESYLDPPHRAPDERDAHVRSLVVQ